MMRSRVGVIVNVTTCTRDDNVDGAANIFGDILFTKFISVRQPALRNT